MNNHFTTLDAWKRGYDFMRLVYQITEHFSEKEELIMVSQLRRAALSIPVNIAEGNSSPSNRDYFKFLCISFKSARECECLIMAARDVGYRSKDEFNDLRSLLDRTCAILYKLLKRIEALCRFKGWEYNQGYKKRVPYPARKKVGADERRFDLRDQFPRAEAPL